MASGKCPKCEKVMGHLIVETPPIHQAGSAAYKGVTLLCPWCRTVLSAAIDPIAIKSDIISKIKG